MRVCRLTANSGFTLVEMLISVAIAGVVGMAALTVYTSATRTTTAQTDLTQVQQNIRASMDRVAQHVRAAGFGLPERESFTMTFEKDGVTNTFTRPVTVTNSATGPDTLDLVGIGHEAGVLLMNADQVTADCNKPQKACLWLDSNDDFKQTNGTFNPLRKYISLGGAAFLVVTGVDGDHRINLSETLANIPDEFFQINPPASVFILQALRYSIITSPPASDPTIVCSTVYPCLAVEDFSEINGSGQQVLAQGIEDLQIGTFTSAADDEDPASFSNDSSSSSADIAALRINLVGIAQTADQSATFTRPGLEDRPAGDVADHFRRRTLTTAVKVRNPKPDS